VVGVCRAFVAAQLKRGVRIFAKIFDSKIGWMVEINDCARSPKNLQ
jgi:hypothetical protein